MTMPVIPPPAAPPQVPVAAPPAAAPPPVVAAPPPAAPPPPVTQQVDPAWLADRLARERTSLMTEMGIGSPAEGKSMFDKLKQLQDAQKTDAERAADRIRALEDDAKTAKELRADLQAYADGELARLTQEQREAVVELAGADPGKQLKALKRLQKTWNAQPAAVTAPVVGAPATGTPPVAGAPAVVPPVVGPPAPQVLPQHTAPPPGSAPTGAPNTSPPDVLAQYEALEASPFAKAEFRRQNYAALMAAEQARASAR